MEIAVYQPDIPQNVGSLTRLCACLGVALHIIEPCGFILDDKRLKRVAMDYAELAEWRTHRSWEAFRQWQGARRLLLLSTRARDVYTDFAYAPGDILLLGRESGGVPEEVAALTDHRLRIPMAAGARSLNVALAAAMVGGEARRQLGY